MSLTDIKRFLFVSLSISNISDINKSSDILEHVKASVDKLIQEGKSDDILKEIKSYHSLYVQSYFTKNKITNRVQANVDSLAFLLACCLKSSKDSNFSHNSKFLTCIISSKFSII